MGNRRRHSKGPHCPCFQQWRRFENPLEKDAVSVASRPDQPASRLANGHRVACEQEA